VARPRYSQRGCCSARRGLRRTDIGKQRGAVTRAVVLGASGFLGSWVARALVSLDIPVITVGRRTSDETRRLDVEADILDLDLVGICDDADVIFDLAGTGDVPRSLSEPAVDLRANLQTTVAVLDAARRATDPPRVVLVSSAAVYGESVTVPMAEDHPLLPISPYGVSKLAAEHYLRVFHRLYGLRGIAVRPFSVYGPGQRKLVVYDLLKRIVDGERPLRILAPADVTRDFVYVEDVAAAIVALARDAPAKGEAYNLASGHATSLRELADALLVASGVASAAVFVGDQDPGNPAHWCGDTSKAASLGVTLDTTLARGLAKTVQWIAM
jgi:UDP-glucose 4-epimerase